MWHLPGDVITDDFLIEEKTTSKKSFSVNKKLWRKIYKEALRCSRLPVIKITVDIDSEPLTLVVLDNNDFESWVNEEE